MLSMRDMTDQELDGYVEMAIAAYARDDARATGTPPDEALERARSQILALLPEGRPPPGQHLQNLVSETGDVVGTIWHADELEADPPRVFLYDIRIDAEHRGEGLGSVAMGLLEEEARRRGAAELKLHVFDHNVGAIRLYERLGYEVTFEGTGGRQMTKRL